MDRPRETGGAESPSHPAVFLGSHMEPWQEPPREASRTRAGAGRGTDEPVMPVMPCSPAAPRRWMWSPNWRKSPKGKRLAGCSQLLPSPTAVFQQLSQRILCCLSNGFLVSFLPRLGLNCERVFLVGTQVFISSHPCHSLTSPELCSTSLQHSENGAPALSTRPLKDKLFNQEMALNYFYF